MPVDQTYNEETATGALAREVVDTRYEDLPELVAERIRLSLMDSVGIAILSASQNPNASKLIGYATESGAARPESTLLGASEKVSCWAAAGANSEFASSAGFDETGPGVHALTTLAMTALAVGEYASATGAEVITALALAYEVNGRFARAAFPYGLIHGTLPPRDTTYPGHFRHYGATCAVTAARLLGLSHAQTSSAIGFGWRYTALYATEQLTGDGLFPFGEGFNLGAAAAGIHSAFLARAGFAGPSGAIEAERHHDICAVISSPEPWHYVANELHLKPWMSSRGIHAALTAACDLVEEHAIAPADIVAIRFISKNEYVHPPFNTPAPRAWQELINSVPWAFALAILGIPAGPAWLDPETIREPFVKELADKVIIEEDPRANEIWFSGVWISNETPVELELVTREQTFRRRVTFGEALGSPARPMSTEQLEDKFLRNVTRPLGSAGAARLLEQFRSLDTLVDVSEMMSLTTGGLA